jgi:hypothetical protein
MHPKTTTPHDTVARGLRPVVFLYAMLNIVVATFLLSTVSLSPASGPAEEMASLR